MPNKILLERMLKGNRLEAKGKKTKGEKAKG